MSAEKENGLFEFIAGQKNCGNFPVKLQLRCDKIENEQLCNPDTTVPHFILRLFLWNCSQWHISGFFWEICSFPMQDVPFQFDPSGLKASLSQEYAETGDLGSTNTYTI